MIDVKEENKNKGIRNNDRIEMYGAFALGLLIFSVLTFFGVYVASQIFSGI